MSKDSQRAPRPRNRATAKAAGTRWESAIVAFLQANGFPKVERRRLSGSKDRGDIAGLPVAVEAKDVRKQALAAWCAEAAAEGVNAGALAGVVWWKRIGCPSPADGYVIMTGAQFLEVLRVLANRERGDNG